MSNKIQGLKMEVSVVLKNKDSLKYLQNTISEFTALQSVINKCFSLLEKNIKKNDKLLDNFSYKLKSLGSTKLINSFKHLSTYLKTIEEYNNQSPPKNNQTSSSNEPQSKSNVKIRRLLIILPQEDVSKPVQDSFTTIKKIFQKIKNIDFSATGIKNKSIKIAKDVSSLFIKHFSIDGIKGRLSDGIKKVPGQIKNFSEYFLPRKEKKPFLAQYTDSVSNLSDAIDSLGSKKLSAIFKPLKNGNLIISNLQKIKGALKDLTSVDGKFNLFKTMKFGTLTAGLYLVSYLFGKFTDFVSKNKKVNEAWQKVVTKTKKIISSVGKAFLEFILVLFGINSDNLESGLISAFNSIGDVLDKLEEKIIKAREWIKENKDLIKEWGDVFVNFGKAAGLAVLTLIEFTNLIFKIFFGKKDNKEDNKEIDEKKKLEDLHQIAKDLNTNLQDLIDYLGQCREGIKNFADNFEQKKESFWNIVKVISAITLAVTLLTGNIWGAVAAFGALLIASVKSQEGNSQKIIELRKNISPTSYGYGYGLKYENHGTSYTDDRFGIKSKREATGTNYFPGGLTTINEQGDELILGPTGMIVANNPSTTNIMRDLSTVKGNLSQIKFGINGDSGRVKANNITINIGNISNRSDIDYLARQISMLDLS